MVKTKKKLDLRILIALGLIILLVAISIGLINNYQPSTATPSKRSYAEWIKLINELDLNLGEGNFSEKYQDYEQAIRQYKTKNGKITIILCEPFAYQEAYMAVYSDAEDKNHQALIFSQFINPSETFGTRIPLGLEYDEKTQIFTSFSKGRGAADCGALGKYQFKEETQSIEVIEFRLKECDDQTGYQKPDSWPLIFSAP